MTRAGHDTRRTRTGFGLAAGVFLSLLAVFAQLLLPAAHALTCSEPVGAPATAVLSDCCDEPTLVAPAGPTVDHDDVSHGAPCDTCAALSQLHSTPDLLDAPATAVAAPAGDVSFASCPALVGRSTITRGARAPPLA